MTHRLRTVRTIATMLACSATATLALAMSADTASPRPASKDKAALVKRSVRTTPAVAKPAAKPVRDRIALRPHDPKRPLATAGNKFFKPQKRLVTSEASAFTVEPLSGTGVMMTPNGNPIIIQVSPSKATNAWVGKVIGDFDSYVFVLPTKWGHVGTVFSEVWGSFNMVPDGEGNVTLRSCNIGEFGTCGTLDWEPAIDINAGGAFGGLAGAGGECWVDTADQTATGTPWPLDDEDDPVGTSISVDSSTGTCAGEDLLVDGPDNPDFRIRDPDCNGFPDINTVVDILFGYSADALAEYGSEAAIWALANGEIALLNESFVNSQMRTRARLIGVELGLTQDEQPYVSSGNPPYDLNSLVLGIQPFMGLENLMWDLRDERGADLVTLLVANNNTGIAGIASNIPEGAVIGGVDVHLAGAVYDTRSALSLTYQHEVGHLIGGCHGSPNAEIEGLNEGTCPCPDPVPACDETPALFTPNFPDEYHYGLRFEEEIKGAPTGRILQTIMAYPNEDGTSIRIPFFSNPFVEYPWATVPVGKIADDGECCVNDGETAANALVMDFYMGATVSDPDTAFPGIAQYRCKKIPYDCNQNGILDTEEIDGISPNPDQLQDLNGDRVADGCLPRPCIGDADLTQPERTGLGGIINDFSTIESAVAVPFGPTDTAWAFQPLEVRIDGLVHMNIDDLVVSLVHRTFNGEETEWTLIDCNHELPDSAAQVLSGMYTFLTPTSEAAYDTLETDSLCQAAAAGGLGGGLITPGIYRSVEALTGNMTTRSEAGTWLLRITDTGIGDTGFFDGWALRLAILPYEDDCDGDGFPDGCVENFSLDTDCNQNNLADSCEISEVLTRDCNFNGRLDTCEDTSSLIDCGGPLWDVTGDGNVDGADFAELNLNCPGWLTGTGNCRPDLCDIIDDPSLDANGNYFLDQCEPGGGGVGCESRVYDSNARGNSGPGRETIDLGMVTSSITIGTEPDDGSDDPVLVDATIRGGVNVVLNGFQHEALDQVELRIRYTTPDGITVVLPLMEVGCSASGYANGGTYTFRDFAGRTICEQAGQGGPIGTASYQPEASLSAYIGMKAYGTWTLEVLDVNIGETGGFDSWDITFVHRPPDYNGNGTPDVCEP